MGRTKLELAGGSDTRSRISGGPPGGGGSGGTHHAQSASRQVAGRSPLGIDISRSQTGQARISVSSCVCVSVCAALSSYLSGMRHSHLFPAPHLDESRGRRKGGAEISWLGRTGKGRGSEEDGEGLGRCGRWGGGVGGSPAPPYTA